MLSAAYSTVEPIEVVWTLVGAVGVVFSLFNLVDAGVDRRIIKKAGIQNGRRAIANFTVRSELARTAIQTIFVSIGVLALFVPNVPVHLHGIYEASNLVSKVGLVIAEILILFKSIDAYMVRHLLRGD